METAAAVRKRKSPPLGKRPWTPEDENYLAEKWGYASVPAIAKKLNRTENAVVVRAQRLGLGAVLMAGGYVTLNQLLATVTGRERGNTYQRKSWVENRGLPVHRKKVNRCSFSVVYLEEFWEWAERNRSFLDFSKMEPLALGWEPSWVAEQRKKDYCACAIQRKDPWTADEDSRLKMLLSQHKYTWAELSEMLHRTTGAIQHRCRDLGIKNRPVKADNHGKKRSVDGERLCGSGRRYPPRRQLHGNRTGARQVGKGGARQGLQRVSDRKRGQGARIHGRWSVGSRCAGAESQAGGAFVHYQDGGTKATVISGRAAAETGE